MYFYILVLVGLGGACERFAVRRAKNSTLREAELLKPIRDSQIRV